MSLFKTKIPSNETSSERKDFEFISKNEIYFDSACQTLRPQPVIDAVCSYYKEYNACGGRVKYQWGKKVDSEVDLTRQLVLQRLSKATKDYKVAFTLNTTYGLNLILNQLPQGIYTQITTSEIEHNSVFLPVMSSAKRLDLAHTILERDETGHLLYTKENISNAIVVLNATSNIDGRTLQNMQQLADDVHTAGGILIIDGAQSLVHEHKLLHNVDFDALCFSGHKTYGPSLGIIVIKNTLLNSLQLSFIGGGMVEKLESDSFSIPEDDPVCKLEPGLQDYAGIIGLQAALHWLPEYQAKEFSLSKQQTLESEVFNRLSSIDGINVINKKPSSIVSFYSDVIDSHRLAIFLSKQNIMVRSGYFCCHYYLQNIKKYPPLLRISMGLHTTKEDVDQLLEITNQIITNTK